MDLDLAGTYALVGGSTQGIGKAVAMELSLLGATIILLARDETKLQQTVKELDIREGQKHSYICADFTDPVTVQQKVEAYLKKNPPIHILINNTGGPPAGPVLSAKAEEFLSAFSNHLICNHLLAQALIPGMKAASMGRIINIISTSVKQPIPGLGVSNTIRAAVGNWSKTLAAELGPFGITVNNVLPGAANTTRLQNIFENKAHKTGKTVEEIKQEMIHEIPAARIAEPNEIANAVAFLASPAASYINGINIPVDGGRTLCL